MIARTLEVTLDERDWKDSIIRLLCGINVAASGLHAELLCDACLSPASIAITDVNNGETPLRARIIWSGGFPDTETGCEIVTLATIDWGDGNQDVSGPNPDVVSFVSAAFHDYDTEGDYVISIILQWDHGILPTDTIRLLVSVQADGTYSSVANSSAKR